MYIEELRIQNLRCFESAEIDFVRPSDGSRQSAALGNVNLLLGDNGAGKTTVLRAIVLAVLGDTLSQSGFVPYRLVRRADHRRVLDALVAATLYLDKQDAPQMLSEGKVWTALQRQGDFDIIKRSSRPGGLDYFLYQETSPSLFLVGYGSMRRVELSDRFDIGAREKSRRLRYQRVATLFEEHVGLIPLSLWLPNLEQKRPERFAEVSQILNELLGGQAQFTGERDGPDYTFKVGGVPAPFPALSDGYRAFIGWVGDLLYHMCQVCPPRSSLRKLQGLVLVDEIDLHLHPDWQRTVVPDISAALPMLQFIFTTHSALVAGTLRQTNILVVESEYGQPSTIRRLREQIHGLGVDQILLGSYFNLRSTRSPDVDDRLLDLSRRAREGDEHAALGVLRILARGVPSPNIGDDESAMLGRNAKPHSPKKAPEKVRKEATKKAAKKQPKKAAKKQPKKAVKKQSKSGEKKAPKKVGAARLQRGDG